MAYLNNDVNKTRMTALGAVAIIHLGLAWAFFTGILPILTKTVPPVTKVFNVDSPIQKNDPPPPADPDIKIQTKLDAPEILIQNLLPPAPDKAPDVQEAPLLPSPTGPVGAQSPNLAPPASVRTVAVFNGRTSDLISQADYPSASLRAEEEGTTTVRFQIGVNGRVIAKSCTIERSSGFTRLDERTCDIIERRFRFKPATENGKPVPDQKLQSVRWQINTK